MREDTLGSASPLVVAIPANSLPFGAEDARECDVTTGLTGVAPLRHHRRPRTFLVWGAGVLAAMLLGLALLAGGPGWMKQTRSMAAQFNEGKEELGRVDPRQQAGADAEPCHTVVEDGQCFRDVLYIKETFAKHPEWYPGLHESSEFEAFQEFLYYQGKCPKPCWGSVEAGDATARADDAANDSASKKLRAGTTVHDNISADTEWATTSESSTTVRPESTAGEDTIVRHSTTLAAVIANASEEPKKVKEHAESCHPVLEGSTCYKKVMWVMEHGILTHPEWYKALNTDSTFTEVQAHLHNDPETHCPQVCDCHTALKGEMCYERITWVMESGLKDNPEWYVGLSASSTAEEVQLFLHKDPGTKCAKPCSRAELEPPTVFCFAVVQSNGYEVDVMRAVAKRKAGLFQCDGQAIFSDSRNLVIGGMQTIHFQPAPVGVSKDGTAGNAELFMHVWEAVRKDGRYQKYDWVVKTDPDAVIVASRLREHLAPFTGQAAYVKNCGKWQGAGWPMMFGSLEAVSREAVSAYLDGASRCRNDLDWKLWGEDVYLAACLDYLGVGAVVDLNLIGDGVCTGADCSNGNVAAFHPFKDAEKWLQCWEEATR